MRNKLFFLILLFFFVNTLYALQKAKQDSLSHLSYEQIDHLLKNLDDTYDDLYKKKLANQYTTLAKQTNNPIVLADTYYTLSESYSHSENAIFYADSIIQVTKNLENKIYPAKGYLQKGIQLYYLVEYDEALNNYLKANEYYKEQKDDFRKLVIRHYIGLLKNNIDESDEAFQIFKENMSFFEKSENQEKYKQQYLKSLFAIANAYKLNKELDSALLYNEKGIKVSLNTKDKFLYPLFLTSYGGVKMLQKEYRIALDSLKKGNSLTVDKKISLAVNYINISSIYDSINNESKSILYLQKVDSIYRKNPQVIYQVRNAYEILLKKYQEKNDTYNQLEIIKKMLSADSILKNKPKNLGKEIIEKYETPKLISEKEKLIDKLREDKKIKRLVIWFLILFILILSVFIIYIIRKSLINRKRFKILLDNHNNNIKNATNEEHTKEKVKKEDIDLPSDIVTNILNKLDQFEKSRQFAKKQYTLSILAKEFNTNNGYLSKVINAKKGTSFSQYINNLRIDYAVSQLTTNSKLRSYTIEAISKEFGFNTAQSFTTAFHKNTGIYPSYFLKQIKNQKSKIN